MALLLPTTPYYIIVYLFDFGKFVIRNRNRVLVGGARGVGKRTISALLRTRLHKSGVGEPRFGGEYSSGGDGHMFCTPYEVLRSEDDADDGDYYSLVVLCRNLYS